MDPLSVTASIIAVLQLSTKVLGYLNDVKDASKDRTQCAIEMLNLCSLLYKLHDHVETGDPTQLWYTAVGAFACPNGPLDQFKQALEELQRKMTDGGRLKKAGEALVWKFKKEYIANILNRIERLKTLVEIALQMDHFKLSQAIKDDTDYVRTHMPALQSGVNKIQQDQADTKHDKIVEWISPTNYPAQQSDIMEHRQEGTGQWFLDAPEFTWWRGEPPEFTRGEPKGTLFCPGIPGAGKTMVAATAIDHLLLKSSENSSIGVAYVYCNYKAQEEQDVSSMLAAIVKQLVQARPSAAEPVKQLHKQHAARGTKPSLKEIFSALQEVVAKHSIVYIVVDALDECRDGDGTRRRFLAKLRELQVGQDIRLMATSRYSQEIEVEFQETPRLEVRASNKDVERFVTGRMDKLPSFIKDDPMLQKIVVEKILETVDGMFLLAYLLLGSLSDKTTVKEVMTTLSSFSKSSAALDNAYKNALQRIKSQPDGHYKLAKKVLSWITYARRPLTTDELRCALAVELGEAELDPYNIPGDKVILSVCAGLVVVDQESAVIRLVHYTTQEYFERVRDSQFPDAPLEIASICLTYLSFDAFKMGSCSSDREFEERLEVNKFLNYAATHWGEHAAVVEKDVCALACSFLSNKSLVSSTTQVFFVLPYRYGGMSQGYPRSSTGLHLAARFGLSVVLEDMLPSQGEEKATLLGKKDSWGQASLYLAAEHGHSGVVKLLLDKGADINSQGGNYSNALQVASVRGHEAIVKLLLEKGANVNAQGGRYGSALQAASDGGHEAIVKLLLEKGPNVNAQGGYYGSALQAASDGGHEAIVKLLLEKGADVNAQGGRYGNALQAASDGGHEAIVKLLLEKGANVNAQGGRYGNALQAASFRGHEAIIKLLFEKGANVNAQGGRYGNALQAASVRGHEAIVKLLFEKGADVNAQGGNYGSALQAASFRGHEAIVKLLLEKGADPIAEGPDRL